MIDILIGQKIHGETADLSSPTKSRIGFATHRANEPVTEKTKKIINHLHQNLKRHKEPRSDSISKK